MKGEPDSAPLKMSLERVAHHEAGHAVCGLLLQLAFSRVTIKSADDYLGVCVLLKPQMTFMAYKWDKKLDGYDLREVADKRRDRAQAEKVAMFDCAGYVAEHRFTGGVFTGEVHALVGATSDFDTAVTTLEPVLKRGDDIMGYFNEVLIKTIRLITRPANWFLVERIAAALLERETLTLDQAQEIERSARADYAGLGRSLKTKWQSEAAAYLNTQGLGYVIACGQSKQNEIGGASK
jgi:hypothetical protein